MVTALLEATPALIQPLNPTRFLSHLKLLTHLVFFKKLKFSQLFCTVDFTTVPQYHACKAATHCVKLKTWDFTITLAILLSPALMNSKT